MALHAGVETALRYFAVASGVRETGGLLLGWWEGGAVVVRHAVEVTDPTATGTSWTRDETRSSVVLDSALATLEHPWLGYVGDWHTHPAPRGASSQDRRSIRRASRGYEDPLVLVVRRSDGILDIRSARRGRTVPTVRLAFEDRPEIQEQQ